MKRCVLQVSVLTPGGPAVHWFTGTPNPRQSLFKPFVFCDAATIGDKTRYINTVSFSDWQIAFLCEQSINYSTRTLFEGDRTWKDNSDGCCLSDLTRVQKLHVTRLLVGMKSAPFSCRSYRLWAQKCSSLG